MEYVYAALMLHKLDKAINEANLTKVVKAAGVDPDAMKIKALVSALGGVNIEEAIKSASFIPAVGVAGPSTPAAQGQPAEAAKKEEKKKEEQPKEEEALAGLSSLFGN